MMGPGYGFGASGCGPIALIIGLVVIGMLIFFLTKKQRSSHEVNKLETNQHALELLKTRLAQGEITSEEFQSIKEAIKK
jgi:putative membrane protein